MPELENEEKDFTLVVLKFPKDKLKTVETYCKSDSRVRNDWIINTATAVAKNESKKNF